MTENNDIKRSIMYIKKNELIKMYKSTIYHSLIFKGYSDLEAKKKLDIIIDHLNV